MLLREFCVRDTNLAKADVGYYRCSISSKMGDALRSVGRSRSSDEVSVMDVERRASVIWSYYFKTTVVNQWNDGRRKDKIVSCK
jgi:hypothetical protein